MTDTVEPDPQRPRGRLTIEITSRTIWQVIGAILVTLIAIWAMREASHLLEEV